MSKYREILKGDVAPKSALNALARKVAAQGRAVGELLEARRVAQDAAAQRTELDLFVTRAELLEALETGEQPEAWTAEDEGAPPEGEAGDGQ